MEKDHLLPKRKYIKKDAGVFKFVGINARSKFGCFACKKRSIKCDESKPSCGLCLRKKRVCAWPTPELKSKNQTVNKLSNYSVGKSTTRNGHYHQMRNNESIVMTKFPAAGTTSPTILPTEFDDSKTEGNDLMGESFLSSNNINNSDFISNPQWNAIENLRRFLKNKDKIKKASQMLLSGTATDTPSCNLTKPTLINMIHEATLNAPEIKIHEDEMELVDLFCDIAEKLSLQDGRFSMHLSLIISRISLNQGIIWNSIMIWGAVLKGGGGKIDLEVYLKAVKDSISKLLDDDYDKNSCTDALLSCLLLARTTIIVSSTPIKWYEFLHFSKQIVDKFELLNKKELMNADYCFILSNICFQDLHCSQTFHSGETLFTRFEYGKILEYTQSDFYPPFDCLDPLFECSIDLVEQSKKSQKTFEMLKDPSKINNWVYTEIFNTYVRLGIKLDHQIFSTHPLKRDLRLIKIQDFEMHLSLYELYQFCAQLYLRSSIRKYPPRVPENQIYLVKSFNLLRFLVNSPVKNSLVYPLLVAGINCVLESDKVEIKGLLEKYRKSILISYNVDKVEQIIEEYWIKNPGGFLCISWYHIALEKGWTLNMS